MSKYDDMRAFYERRERELQKDIELWRSRWIDAMNEKKEADDKQLAAIEREKFALGKCELYEQLLNKLLGDPTKGTDELLVLNGDIYKMVSYSLDHDPERADLLSVNFIKWPDK